MANVNRIVFKHRPTEDFSKDDERLDWAQIDLTCDEITVLRMLKIGHSGLGTKQACDALQSTMIKVRYQRFRFAFEELAKRCIAVIRGEVQTGFVKDGPIQSLRVCYEDGTTEELLDQSTFLLDEDYLSALIGEFLPEETYLALFIFPKLMREDDNLVKA